MPFTTPPIAIATNATQPTNIGTAVTCNGQAGKITTQTTGGIASGTEKQFTWNNSFLATSSIVILNLADGVPVGTGGVLSVGGKSVANGSMNLSIANGDNGGAADNPAEINYYVINTSTVAGESSPPLYTTGTVTQGTNGTTPVTLNAQAGVITTFNNALAAQGTNSFVLNNTFIKSTSRVFMTVQDYAGAYITNGIPVVSGSNVVDGAATVVVVNNEPSGGAALSGSVKIGFLIL